MYGKNVLLLCGFLYLASCRVASGQSIMVGPDGKFEKQTIGVPYAFYNENFGFTGGYVYAVTGAPQKQSAIIATGMVGTLGSAMGFVMGRDLQVPACERLFLDAIVQIGYFRDSEIYVNGRPEFEGERAGSNSSDKHNYLESEGWDNFFRFKFKYLLPIGHGRHEIIHTQVVDDGMLVDGETGATSWNPLDSGLTYLEVKPFYRWQEVDSEEVRDDARTNGVDLSLFRDNRDFKFNPTRGSALRLRLQHDFGWFDSSDEWTVLDGEFDKYFSLGTSDWFRQRVFAFDFWTAYSPSWDERDGGIDNRPPSFAGATLGGLFRMRGYPSSRFSDKACIYYAGEFRLIPKWNPFDDWPGIQKYLGVEWLQFVPFAEVGRVAPHWNVERLHSDMKWDVGLGVRAWAKGLVVRIDAAVSDEGAGVQMMVAQPFQF